MKDQLLDAIQAQPHQGVNVDPTVRRDLEETYRALRIADRILPVKEFRDDIKSVRERIADGTIVLVSEGGRLKAPSDTTVVLSLATLQHTLAQAIERGIATATRRRGRAADFLVGLPKVPKAALNMDWELDLGDEAAGEESDLDI